MKLIFISLAFFLFVPVISQQNHGTIKVRKTKKVQGLYVLEEGDYYKEKLYVRLFDKNEAVFLRGAMTPERAKDSTARILYTYRRKPASYRVVNDSVFIDGTENGIPFKYKGLVKNGNLSVRKTAQNKQSKAVFKKL